MIRLTIFSVVTTISFLLLIELTNLSVSVDVLISIAIGLVVTFFDKLAGDVGNAFSDISD